MHRKQKASFAHISRSEGMTALKPRVNLPLKEKKKTTKDHFVWCFFLTLPPALSVPSMEQLLYETAPPAYPALTSEALGGSRSPCPAPGLSKAPANPRGAALRPCPLLRLLLLLLLPPASRRCQSESAGSIAAASAAASPSCRSSYRRCRRPAAPAQALLLCNSLIYIPAWTWTRLPFPLNVNQILPPQGGTSRL